VKQFGASMPGRFQMSEAEDPDGVQRLILTGELDLAVADRVQARLTRLRRAGASVRLDLSRLSFIDSSGVRALILARATARRNNWRFEIDPEVSPKVRQPLELLGLSSYLWPGEV
jgi:anti-anti-sigma factor